MDPDRVLLMGNEAIARGAVEGGIAYGTGYPGNPSSEIIEALFSYQDRNDIKVEWSVNEMVALEKKRGCCFQIMTRLDRDKGQQRVQCESENAGQQAPCDTYGEAPVFKVGHALAVWMIGHCIHGLSLVLCEVQIAEAAVRIGRKGVR